MLKLRKDPTIPPSATATVNTSTTNAFPVSPRLGGSGGDSRGSRGGHQRTSPKSSGTGTGNNAASASASSSTSVSATQHTTNGGSAAIGYNTLGSPGYAAGSNGPAIGTAGVGATAGAALAVGNGGYSRQDAANIQGSRSPLQPSTSSINTPNTYKFDTNGALWALSASPDYSMVAVVGRDGKPVLSWSFPRTA